jgi:hypothetical protein
VRPQTRGSSKLRGEMHAGESGRRSDIGEAHGLVELGLDILEGTFQPPSRKFAHFRPLGRGCAVGCGQKPRDDGDADAIRVDLSERAAYPVAFEQRAPQRIDHQVLAGNALRANHRRLPARHVARAFGYQSVGNVQVQDIVGATKQATNRYCGFGDVHRPRGRHAVVHDAARCPEANIHVPQHDFDDELLLHAADEESISRAEHCFSQALEVAREQGAKSWELRSALSFARLRIRQDRQGDARQLLEPHSADGSGPDDWN